MNILLVSPATPTTFWSLKHAVRFVSKRAAFPPLGLLTVAAMLPRSWNLRLVDMDVTRLRDADIQWADYVLVSAMIVHKQSVQDDLIPRCKRLGKPIIGGGPLFTTGHEEFAGDVHAVLGECEESIGGVIRDMEAGSLQDKYRVGRMVSQTSPAHPSRVGISSTSATTRRCRSSFRAAARSIASSATSSS